MEKKIKNSISSISCLHTITANFLLDELAKEGLSNIASSHGNILFQLSKVEKLSMRELAKKINRDKATTTVLVRKLIKENLIAEEINENDNPVEIKGKQEDEVGKELEKQQELQNIFHICHI